MQRGASTVSSVCRPPIVPPRLLAAPRSAHDATPAAPMAPRGAGERNWTGGSRRGHALQAVAADGARRQLRMPGPTRTSALPARTGSNDRVDTAVAARTGSRWSPRGAGGGPPRDAPPATGAPRGSGGPGVSATPATLMQEQRPAHERRRRRRSEGQQDADKRSRCRPRPSGPSRCGWPLRRASRRRSTRSDRGWPKARAPIRT